MRLIKRSGKEDVTGQASSDSNKRQKIENNKSSVTMLKSIFFRGIILIKNFEVF